MINFLDKKLHYLTKSIIKMRNMNLNNRAISISGIKLDLAKYLMSNSKTNSIFTILKAN